MPAVTAPLLAADEPPPSRTIRGNTDCGCLLVCDHASARIPLALKGLGLSERAKRSHLVCDHGAGALTLAVAAELKIPAVMCNYSRLVVDCNRSLDDPSAFLTFGDGMRIAGNCDLTEAERKQRADAIYWPYHRAVDAALAEIDTSDERAALVSLHSFSPVLEGIQRPWDAGVLWDTDERLAEVFYAGLDDIPGVRVGDNVPYSGRSSADFTVDYHGESAGRAHVALEVRQDHIATDAGVAVWAERLSDILRTVLDDPGLRQPNPLRTERPETLRAAAAS
ncbi:MAG: N-formylglutamate amidohydrolase [Pseudomonadota bacterium]